MAPLPLSPAAEGFAMPAEFAPHAGTWTLWPTRRDNWRLGAQPAQAAFVAMVSAIAGQEPVTVCAPPEEWANARAKLPAGVKVVELSSDDCWMRDTGPTFLRHGDGRRLAADWRFNAWGGFDGGLYWPWDRDDLVAAKVAELAGVRRARADFVLEGGAIHVDGAGSVLVTEQCLLNPNRNPHLDRAGVEAALRAWLGVEAVLWLGQGVVEDETDGHVDNLATFLAPGLVALSWCDDVHDPQHAVSQDALERLSAMRDARGQRLEVVKLPQPGPLFMSAEEAAGVAFNPNAKPRAAGDRLAASYANMYLCNGAVVLPVFDDPADAEAIRRLESVLDGRRVIPVQSRELLLGGGNIHCLTQQEPA